MDGWSGRRSRVTLVAMLALLVAAPLGLHARSRAALKAAHRLLERLKLVDGAGSGLDADTVHGVTPLVVRDRTGASVGPVVAADVPISVARKIEGRAMLLQVTEAGFVDTNCPEFLYETGDCTGTPYREASDAFLPFVSVCGTTAYYPVGPAATRTIGSRRLTGDPCVVQPPGSDTTVTTVATFDVATLGLAPPFHLEGP